MCEINHLKKIIMCSDDMTADVDHLHVKIIYLVSFSYIVIDDLVCMYIFMYIHTYVCMYVCVCKIRLCLFHIDL
jgi:hypothetical protein